MKKRWLAIVLLIAGLGIATPGLKADHDRDGEHGKKHFREDDDHRRGDRDDRRGDRDDDRWDRRGGYEYRVYDRDGRPPGWVRGRKVGWRSCGLPPGQAKKYGCWSYVHEGRRYYYYREDDGRIFIRRPTVVIHAGVDIVQ